MDNPVNILCYILIWLLYLVSQSLFINGIFISSYGKTEKYPDGTDKDSEMIFYPIYKYINRTYKKRYYFSRSMLDVSAFPKIDGLVVIWDDFVTDGAIIRGFRVVGNGSTYAAEKWIKEYYGGKMKHDQVNHRIAFYTEEDEYVFSKYFRKPTFGCIVCMSSFWSIFTFALPVAYFYPWTWGTTFLWFADIISLAYVNFLIFKRRT